VRVRYRPLNDNKDDVRPSRWEALFMSNEATSTIIDGLAPDRQYSIIVDARNEVGYNSSLTPQRIFIPDAETSKCFDALTSLQPQYITRNTHTAFSFAPPHTFLHLARYVHNVAKRSI